MSITAADIAGAKRAIVALSKPVIDQVRDPELRFILKQDLLCVTKLIRAAENQIRTEFVKPEQ